MVFGLPSGNSGDSDTREMSELKNRIKSAELDFERRITLIENATKEMQKAIGSIGQAESSEGAVLEIQDIKKTLREIEDTGLIAKLETISNGDKIAEITSILEEVNEKIRLLSDAVEILSETKAPGNSDNPAALKEISSLRSEIEQLKNALSKIDTDAAAEPKKISELATRISSLENAGTKSGEKLREAYEAYSKKIELLEERISSAPEAPGIQKDVSGDISKLRGDIEKLKELTRRIIETIETKSIDSGENEKTGVVTNDAEYKNMQSTIAELSGKISEITREMNLERAMYPQDIAGLKKEMGNLKAVQKSLADTLESIAKMKKGNANTPYTEDKMKSINTALTEISGKISEISAIRGKVNALDGELKSVKDTMNKRIEILPGKREISQATNNAYAESKKIEMLEKTMSELSERLSRLQNIKADISEELAAINEKINSEERNSARIGQKSENAESRDTNTLLRMIKTIAEDNRNLRQEIEQLKQAYAEIMKDNRAQPIIID